MLRIFVSSTSKDLRHYRQVVGDVILEQRWHPVMMEHFGTSTGPTLHECLREVRSCDLVVLILAFRRGWVPSPEQGGDGDRSVTAAEVDEARRRGIPIRALLARESWPGSCWEDDQTARAWVSHFRDGLNQVAKFFDVETLDDGSVEPRPGREFRSLVRGVLQDHRDWLREQDASAIRPERSQRKPVGADVVLTQLEPLLDGLMVPRNELTRLYHESAPIGWGPPPEDRNPIALLSGCVQSLARAPRQGSDGQFPLLRFVRSLGELRGGEEAVALRGWLDAARAQLGLDAAESAPTPADMLETALESKSSALTCYLLVQVSPRLCELNRYSVRAWLLGTGEPACICAGEDGVTADALPACLDELREELLRRQIEPEQAWIELLLPRELLCADVDQWRVELDFIESIPIGAEHRLVVRSLERASRPRAVQALQSRARSLRQRLRGGCRLVDEPASREGEAVWIEGNDCGGAALYTALKDARDVVGAVLGQAPRPEPRDPARDVLNTVFAAGLPVVLWVRREATDERPGPDRAELARLLGQVPLSLLPDRVWELRRQAVRSPDPDHLGRHLTLLWEDPARRSPDFDETHRLRTPLRESGSDP
jgi:vWA-MoxR associated protein C-terminal domain/Domain of unknown function (DUF4062)/vWA-MoxR associated protein middle region 0